MKSYGAKDGSNYKQPMITIIQVLVLTSTSLSFDTQPFFLYPDKLITFLPLETSLKLRLMVYLYTTSNIIY